MEQPPIENSEKPQKKPNSLGGHINQPNYIPGANAQSLPSKEQLTKEFENLKQKLDSLKKKILKQYKFTISIGIIPGQAAVLFEEEEQLPKEVTNTKPIHLALLIPEEQFKNIPKIKPEVLKMIKETKENLWLHIWTPVDIWNFGLDSRPDFLDAIASSFPIYDNGFLGALRVASIHKSLLLRRFDKYIATYGIGGSLVRGTADATSDVDTFVIIDDTDVKRMPRMELLEKLRNIAYDYIREATALAGVKNILNVQVYLLTEFWQNVKDAHPVIFTFIRDGVPLHDRGTFLPWKMLLKMGKIKPSQEAIDLFMRQGDQTDEFVKRRLMDAMIDVYYGVVTPTQALMMLAGEAPPVPKTIVSDAKKLFVDKEKWLDMKDIKTLEKLVKLFKAYEHGTLKEVSGKEVDELLKDGLAYHNKLKKVRKQIEAYMQKKTAEELYADIFKILKAMLGAGSQEKLIVDFDKKIIKQGKLPPRFSKILRNLAKEKRKLNSGKIEQKEADALKKDALELIGALTEYQQRKDVVAEEKGSLLIKYNDNKAELVLTPEVAFLVETDLIRKIENDKLANSNKEEFEKALAKGTLEKTNLSLNILKILEKELKAKIEIVF